MKHHQSNGSDTAREDGEELARERAERMAAQRLLQEQILESQKLGAVARLAGGAVHDLNNLLMAMAASISVADRGLPEDSPVHEQLTDLREALATGNAIARQLLDLVREPADHATRVSVDDLLETALPILRTLSGETVRVSTDLGADDVKIYACPTDLQRIVMNLVMNARDAMPEGGRVRLSTRLQIDGGVSEVVLTVSDEGVGIPSEAIGRIFDPFFTTKGDRGGTGLGLYVVNEIVGRMGGRLRVRTREGEGTEVQVGLPVLRDHSAFEGGWRER